MSSCGFESWAYLVVVLAVCGVPGLVGLAYGIAAAVRYGLGL